MLSKNLKYVWVAITLLALNSCSYIVGRKTKRVSVYVQSDSVSIITPEGIATREKAFSIIVENKKPTLELRAVQNGDTTTLTYARRVRDFCLLEPGLRSAFRLDNDNQGRAYTYPRKLYVNLSQNNPKPLSAFPFSRKGWLRINFGGYFYNRLTLDGREQSYALTYFPSYRLGLEYFVSDKFSISSEIGYSGGTNSYIDTTNISPKEYFVALYYFNNNLLSYHTNRWSFGAGISTSIIDFERYEQSFFANYYDRNILESYRSFVLNPIFRINYAIRPKSSIYLALTPNFGIKLQSRTASFMNLGWLINLPLLQPKANRTRNKPLLTK